MWWPCGWTKTPPVADETDYLTLAQTAKEKIQTEFANLINEWKNLRKVGDVTKGDAIMTKLKATDQTRDVKITEDKFPETIVGFLEILNQQVGTMSNNLAKNYPELKPLFNGINPNGILKINTTKLNDLFTSKKFTWKDNNFGIDNFNAKDSPYFVSDWYYLTANLNLYFTCLGENGRSNTSDINQTYDMYFANQGSDLSKVVKDVSNKVDESLKDYLVPITGAQKFDLEQHDKDDKLNDAAKTTLTKKITNTHVTITDVSIPSIWRESTISLFFTKFTVPLSTTTEYITTLYKDEENKRVLWFTNAWNYKNLILDNDLDKVTLFGNITLTNWKYDDLRLMSKALPFAVIENETRAIKLADILQKFISIVSDKGILMNKFWATNNPDTINLKMNRSDFDNYKTTNKTFGDTIDYLHSNMKRLALDRQKSCKQPWLF
ncbi:hypothetical protein [Spiroplasma endosymbiont of Nebria brevicollis]|uniref:hypothetical protein n=1 Tax=Spiroplasma endosymbiont of Nebria brevicollis TaxID=3066284 RepID=UPI00313ABCC8